MYKVIGLGKRYINRNQLPLVPKDQLRVSTKETQDVRQSMFDTNEYISLIRSILNFLLSSNVLFKELFLTYFAILSSNVCVLCLCRCV